MPFAEKGTARGGHSPPPEEAIAESGETGCIPEHTKRPGTVGIQRFPGTCQPDGIIPTRLDDLDFP